MISNTQTNKVLEWHTGLTLPFDCMEVGWDQRIDFLRGSDEYYAILATPNARGVALLLITHKNTFGERAVITKITLWCSPNQPDKDNDPNLLFTLGVADHSDPDFDGEWETDPEYGAEH
jgi:hypothetical protein